jgi:hypothetical protein
MAAGLQGMPLRAHDKPTRLSPLALFREIARAVFTWHSALPGALAPALALFRTASPVCHRWPMPTLPDSFNPQSKGLQASRLALFRTIGAICSDAWGTAALGGGPGRGRLGYRACPCGHTTNVPGCLRWLCFARRTTRRLALFHKTVDQVQLQRYRCFPTTREPYGTTLPHTMVIRPYHRRSGGQNVTGNSVKCQQNT